MLGSVNFDDEGTPGQKTVLVDRGILTSYMHDKISAKSYGVKPTGNGRRQSYQHYPIPRMRNTYLTAGPASPEDVIQAAGKGIQLMADDLADAQAVAEHLRPEGVWFCPGGTYSRDEAEAFIAWAARWAAKS
jgi:hypothetical protein